jgi:hypothetical protein
MYSGDANVKGSSSTAADQVVWNWVLNSFKSSANLGSADPLIWRTSDGQNNFVNSLSSAAKIQSVFNGAAPNRGGCVGSSLIGTYETLYTDPNQATGSSSLRDVTINGVLYSEFNWDTTSASTAPIITGAGCYTVVLYAEAARRNERISTESDRTDPVEVVSRTDKLRLLLFLPRDGRVRVREFDELWDPHKRLAPFPTGRKLSRL